MKEIENLDLTHLCTNFVLVDYKNADIDGLVKYIKSFDFNNSVFDQPIKNQADFYSDILKQAFAKFVPC